MKLKPFLLILLIFSACAPEAPKKTADLPEWVIPEDKMIEILTDVHIIEGARIGKKVLGDSLFTIDHYNKLWEKHQITEAKYDSSFRFYTRNADKMDLLYEEVLVNLSTMASKVEGEEPQAEEDNKAPLSTDSLNKASKSDSLKLQNKVFNAADKKLQSP